MKKMFRGNIFTIKMNEKLHPSISTLYNFAIVNLFL